MAAVGKEICTVSSILQSQLVRHESSWKHTQRLHQFYHINAVKHKQKKPLSTAPQSAPTSVGWLGGVGLRVAPPPPDPTLQPEGAALVIEPSTLLQGAEQLVQRIREVRS